MKQITIFSLFFLLILFISCNQEKQNSITQKNKTEHKKYTLPNDEFREKVIHQLEHEKDKKLLANLLDSLDKRNISYCELMKREYEIDDSCYDVARAKYPEPEMTVQFAQLHDDTFDIAHAKFAKQINLTEKEINYITIFYHFNENVKNFCGEY
jgi:hypothetical protein